MSKYEANIKIPVDLANPGQFFACCGLLELAGRLDENTLAWFDSQFFYLFGELTELIPKLRVATFRQIPLSEDELFKRNGKVPKDPRTICPVEISIGPGTPLVADWWLQPRQHNGLKLWSGSNTVIALVEDAFAAIKSDVSVNILTTAIQLPRQPFFYAASRPLHERDIGISMDKIGREFEHLPYVELLTLIALQRFMPSASAPGKFRYCVWRSAISVEIAAAVVIGAVPSLIETTFEFPVIDRDSNGHKQFTRSERTQNA